MRKARAAFRRRNGFTLIELLVVMALILVIFSLGVGYVVFGQDNQHSTLAANSVSGALLGAKQRARHEGVPTGIRILFGTNGQAQQLELIQQPEDYNAGNFQSSSGNQLTFTGVDFQGAAAASGEADESTVQVGDYFAVEGVPTPHQITAVNSATVITLASSATITQGTSYRIIRAPRRLASEDIIQLPPNLIIDQTLSKNVPTHTEANGFIVGDVVFAPSGEIISQSVGSGNVVLWLRDPSVGLAAGAPALVSVQVRSGLIGAYPVAPWTPPNPGAGNDPYLYTEDGRASGI